MTDLLMADRKYLLFALKKADIIAVTCEYNGEGDEGQLDPPRFLNSNGETTEVLASVTSKARDLFYGLLSEYEGGWENDDGAKGLFTWDVPTDKITWVHEERVIEYTYPDPRTREL